MDRLVLPATQHVSATAKEASKDQAAIVVMISILDSLPVNRVNVIHKVRLTSTAIPMEGVPVKVVMLVISAISVQVDISKKEVEDALVM